MATHEIKSSHNSVQKEEKVQNVSL